MRRYFIFYSFIFLYILSGLAYAQEEDTYNYQCVENCVAQFEVANLDFNSPFVKSKIRRIEDYMRCRSLIDKGFVIPALPPEVKVAHVRKHYTFLAQLADPKASVDDISPSLITACTEDIEYDRKKCAGFIKAFRAQDPSFCKDDKECIGLVTLNEKLVGEPGEKDAIYFMRAIRNSDIDLCNDIKKEDKQIMCKAYFSSDVKLCEQCDAFNEFRQEYCENQCSSK